MEPTLSAHFYDLEGDVGDHMGWGRGENNGAPVWDAEQSAKVARCIKGGLRNFYFCGHDWSFLKPMATLTLPEGSSVLAMPDDSGGPEGLLHLSTSDGGSWWQLAFGSMSNVYSHQDAQPDTTGRPQFVCHEPIKGTSPGASNRFQLRFWPTPDQDYVVKFQYFINPNYLTGLLPYAYGGAQHAETLLESCLAVAERLLDDAEGVHAAEFARRLEISKELDRRNKPQSFGRNRNRERNWRNRRDWLTDYPAITVNGVVPD